MTMNERDDDRVERMLAAGKLTAEEAERLRDSLSGRADREAPMRAAAAPHGRRRLWLLIGSLAVFFLLGAATHYLLSDVDNGGVAPLPTTESPAPALPDGRLIDLSGISEERSSTMKRSLPLSFGIVSVGVLAVLAALLVFFYNGLIGAREQVNAGWAQVENVYQRRLDLVPLLVDAVQTYTDHERETLSELTQARANALQVSGAIGGVPQSLEQLKAIEASQGEVASAMARLFAIVENYPSLKASRNFLSLQDQIEGTENRVAMERRNFNEFSRRYNTRLQTFPGNIVAEMLGFETKPYFEAETRALKGLQDPFGRHGNG
jgi:LemA protein